MPSLISFFIVSRAMLIAELHHLGMFQGTLWLRCGNFIDVMMLFLQYLAIGKKFQFQDFWIPHAGTLQQFTRDRAQACIIHGPLANKASRAQRHSGKFFTLELIINNWVISSLVICHLHLLATHMPYAASLCSTYFLRFWLKRRE